MDKENYGEGAQKTRTSAIRSTSPGQLAWMGISSIIVVGLIHLIEAPEELEETTYLGLLFLANFGAAITAAIGIYRNYRWGWLLGVMLAGGSFVGYVASCTVGLPGLDVEEWFQPLGLLSLLVEGLFLGLYLTIFVGPAKEARIN
jgi:uncharacterized membrane protein YfcA